MRKHTTLARDGAGTVIEPDDLPTLEPYAEGYRFMPG